jgi:hypothetical protein
VKKTVAVVVLMQMLGVGCSASPSPTPSPTISARPSIGATPPVIELPGVTLTADLSEAPSKWEEVTSIPIGSDHDALGYKASHESPTIGPNSFAVAGDGTFWIIDAAKQRVVHFSRGGRVIGEIPDSVGSGSKDLAFRGSTLWVISLYHKGIVFPVLPDGRRSAPNVISESGKTVYVRFLIPTQHGLFAEISGYTDPVATGPDGVYKVELPGSGYIEEAPGMALKNGKAFNLYLTDDQEFELQYFDDDRETVQPLRIRVVDSKDFGTKKLEGPVGPGGYVVDGNDVYMYVQMSVSKPDGSGDQIGGRYLLRVGESPILFERVPEPTNTDDTQVRHMALGPDGHLYLMQIDKDGVRIYRR